jgi:uncharacterized protein (TIGR02270 family)
MAATSLHAFKIDLYEEHLEEASFLYDQCRALRADAQLPWTHLAPFEARLEAHLDALVLGGKLAMEVCDRRARVGDAGELYAAVCVVCRHGDAQGLSGLLKDVEFSAPSAQAAVCSALQRELPAQWVGFVDSALQRADPRMVAVLIPVVAHRRLPATAGLAEALQSFPAQAVPIVDALGRLGDAHAQPLVERVLLDGQADDDLKARALLASLRMGLDDPLRRCHLLAHRENWPRLALGIGGDPSAGNVLQPLVRAGRATPECLLALGLLGETASLSLLHEALGVPELAEAAARALQWITGASLYEDVFIPEDDDEPLAHWQQPQMKPRVPASASAPARGQTVCKLSVHPDRWSAWLAQNGSRFTPTLRYRLGQPYGPQALLAALCGEGSDHQLRQLAAEEMAVRYRCEIPFETDMCVAQQMRALNRMSRWVQADGQRFEPGRWYFAARPQ